MAEWLLAYAGAFMPIGVVLYLWAIDKFSGWPLYISVSIGLAFMAVGMCGFFYALKAVKLEKKHDEEKKNRDEYRFQELMVELRRMRNEIIKERDATKK